jgi:predicted cupin superfamily sugar epimerase
LTTLLASDASLGFFAETDRQTDTVASPFAGTDLSGYPPSPRKLIICRWSIEVIGYLNLLSPVSGESNGLYSHEQIRCAYQWKSCSLSLQDTEKQSTKTYHVLHQGRAEYTLIHPPTAGGPPKIERVVMGTDTKAGELRQLLVGTGVWKMSQIPEADLRSRGKEEVGCLITEVVVPGFAWEDHQYLTLNGLKELFARDAEGQKRIEEFREFVKEA